MPKHSLRRSAFTLIELMIVIILLGVLAAMVVPMLQDLSPGARETALKSQLRSLRNQITTYQLNHNGELPAPDQLLVQLMHRTTLDGQIDDRGDFGPYLVSVPSNPFNGRVDVKALPPGGQPAADDTTGWLYGVDGSNFTLVANSSGQDRSGTPLIQY